MILSPAASFLVFSLLLPGLGEYSAERAGAQTRSSVPPSRAPTVDPEVETQIKAVSSAELEPRMKALQTLLAMGERAASATTALIDVLGTSDGLVAIAGSDSGRQVMAYNPVQNLAVEVLAKIGWPAIAPLRAAAAKGDPDDLKIAYVLDALARMQEAEATKSVHEALRHENPSIRRRAADALAHNRDPLTIDALIAAISDPNGGVRSDAARALEALTGQKLGEDAAKWQEWRKTRP